VRTVLPSARWGSPGNSAIGEMITGFDFEASCWAWPEPFRLSTERPRAGPVRSRSCGISVHMVAAPRPRDGETFDSSPSGDTSSRCGSPLLGREGLQLHRDVHVGGQPLVRPPGRTGAAEGRGAKCAPVA
jgi:hypothetical protein